MDFFVFLCFMVFLCFSDFMLFLCNFDYLLRTSSLGERTAVVVRDIGDGCGAVFAYINTLSVIHVTPATTPAALRCVKISYSA